MDELLRRHVQEHADALIARFDQGADAHLQEFEAEMQQRIDAVDRNALFADKEVRHYQRMAALMRRITDNNKARHAREQRDIADR